MTAAVRTTTAAADGAVYRTERHTSVNDMFITTSMVDHNKEKITEYKLALRSCKSEEELALDVLYCSIARSLCDSRVTCSLV